MVGSGLICRQDNARWVDFVTRIANDDVPSAGQSVLLDMKFVRKPYNDPLATFAFPDNFPSLPAVRTAKLNEFLIGHFALSAPSQ